MSMSPTAKANKADQADPPVKADYEIHVTLTKQVVPRMPTIMNVRETVQYKSDDGTGKDAGVVTIEFPSGSPFLNSDGSEKTTVTSKDQPLKLSKKGNFTGHCYITTPDDE